MLKAEWHDSTRAAHRMRAIKMEDHEWQLSASPAGVDFDVMLERPDHGQWLAHLTFSLPEYEGAEPPSDLEAVILAGVPGLTFALSAITKQMLAPLPAEGGEE